ncbi:MAG TPA: ATP-binding protein, partial [Candidatus Deferrimicrobium sp.]
GVPFFDGNGTFRGYRGVDREIGARKRAEEALRKSEEHLLQVRKFEEIGRLAGGLAHHLNNLLTVVTGYSELLLTKVPEVDPRHGEIVKIHAAGERAAELTRELLAFSRRQVLQPRAVEVNRFLSECSTTLRDLAGHSVRFTFSPGEDAGSIRVDPEPLHQALVHLVANARDAMPGGGELNISTAAAELKGRIEGIDAAPGWYALLTVQDSGSGIDAETRTRIFQPFASLKTGSEGMGLPSIYGFVKQSDGYIFVDSRPGRGTTFRIYFPRLDRPEDLLHGDTRPLTGTPAAG